MGSERDPLLPVHRFNCRHRREPGSQTDRRAWRYEQIYEQACTCGICRSESEDPSVRGCGRHTFKDIQKGKQASSVPSLFGRIVQLPPEEERSVISVQPKEKAAVHFTPEIQSCQYRCGA